jgi:hypothetical protein
MESRVARTTRILHLLGEVGRAAAQRREADLAGARALVELVAMDGLHVAHCASAGELGERHGLSAFETRDLLDLGRALPLVPGLEEHVRAGRIPPASGACLGRVYSTPSLLREGDDWISWAQHESTQMLRRRLQKRQDEFRVGNAPVVPLTVFVEREDLDDFHRARTVASRKAGTALSGGATFKILTQHYLASFDVMRRQTGTRRVPDTTYVAGRYIPVAVRREVYDRQQGRCAIPFCDHVLFLDFAHLVWHASGGSREADNLLLLCSEHHTWFDVGAIRLTGTAAAPRFEDGRGNDLSERFSRGEEYPFLRDPARTRPGLPAGEPWDDPDIAESPEAPGPAPP